MVKGLRNYFDNIPTRQDMFKNIQSNLELRSEFDKWTEGEQEKFLNFCTGVKGVKVLYDGFFKELMSPEYHRERLEAFLSALLKEEVKIHEILQNDSTRLADESSLLITDIVVRLANGQMVNIEVQRIGYMFPGQRLACYSSDMLLRQYKWAKSKRGKNFTYRDIKTVYTIVLFEKSTQEFKRLKNIYVHYGKQTFDTGLKLDMIQEFILIPLDIFKKSIENKPIETELEAWLTFFCCDEPEKIIELIEKYPFFKEMYEEAYGICQNIKEVIGVFSKELRELDKNTERYMIEVMQEEIEETRKELEDVTQKVEEEKRKVEEEKRKVEEEKRKVEEEKRKVEEEKRKVEERDNEIEKLKAQLEAVKKEK